MSHLEEEKMRAASAKIVPWMLVLATVAMFAINAWTYHTAVSRVFRVY